MTWKEKIKGNAHIGCLLVFILFSVVACIYMVNASNKQAAKACKELRPDSAAIEQSLRIADRVHIEELSDDWYVQELQEEIADLQYRLDHIKGSAEDIEVFLDDNNNESTIEDVRTEIQDIIDKCNY